MPTMEVEWLAVRAAWRRAGHGEFPLVVRTATGNQVGKAIVDAAVDAANAAFGRESAQGAGDVVAGGLSVSTPNGVVIPMVRTGADDEDLHRWAQMVARLLGEAGVGGKLTAARSAWVPPWASEETGWRQVVGFVAHSPSGAQRIQGRPFWGVDEGATRLLVHNALAWAGRTGYTSYAGLGTFSTQVNDLDAVESWLVDGLPSQGHGAFTALAKRRTGVVRSKFGLGGLCMYGFADAASSIEARLEEVRNVLVANANVTSLAMVRNAPIMSASWQQLLFSDPPMSEARWRWAESRRESLSLVVPDVAGIQLLTAKHMDRAHDLSDWNVTELPGGRFLVEAQNLRDWFGDELVARSVVEDARRDFGAMVLGSDA
jgi:hypothetical protein